MKDQRPLRIIPSEKPKPRSVTDLMKAVKLGMYRKQGDCECDVCAAYAALEELGELASMYEGLNK